MNFMYNHKNNSRPAASAPENQSTQQSSQIDGFIGAFATVSKIHAIEEINRGHTPKVSVLMMSAGGTTALLRCVPVPAMLQEFCEGVNEQALEVVPSRTIFGFVVSNAGHLLDGVEDAYVVFSICEGLNTAFAQPIGRDEQGKVNLDVIQIPIEDPMGLLLHAFGTSQNASDAAFRKAVWPAMQEAMAMARFGREVRQ